uniref:ER membrane protein complex subunit 1 n=1 Tax=Timema genevievae TaxID=629358 RepID=A0A7R9JTW9_TIMGE|nr:unnamed protein product [Timema genevievae]
MTFQGFSRPPECRYHCGTLYRFYWNESLWHIRKRSYIGKLKFSNFDAAPNGKRVFLATEENVVAALNLKSGDILWRHVLEKGSEGVIRFLSVDTDVVTVSGNKDTLLVRGWDPSGGILQWEWPLPKTDHRVEDTHWYMSGSKLYQVTPVALSHVEVTAYNVGTGGKISAHSVPAKWIADTSKCILTTSYLACVSTTIDGKTLFGVLDVMDSEEEAQFWSKPLSEFIGKTPLGPTVSVEPVPGPVPAVIMREAAGNNARYLVYLSPKGPQLFPKVLSDYTSVVTVVLEGQHVLLQASHSADVVEITAHVLETGETISELVGSTHAFPLGPSSLTAAVCKLVWVREEALSSIVAVEMLELPVSDTDAAIEQEFDHKETGILGMFVHRISSQIIQLRSSLMTLLGDRMSEGQSSGLVRDEFGLHKIIVAATASGKLFGIDNLSGEILWQRRLEDAAPFLDQTTDRKHMVLYIQRTTRHFPHPAQCLLLFQDKNTGKGSLFVFNPFTGQPTNEGLVKLGFRIKQSSLLHQPNKEFLRGVLLLDDSNNIHVFPESTREVAHNIAASTFLFTGENNGTLTGYTLMLSPSEHLLVTEVWKLHIDQPTIEVVGKNPMERVHSQGRVLGDRSVLYKYVNPNLVAVVTQAPDPLHKYLLSIFLVDVVSGAVVFSVVHKRAKGPVHLVHSENWLVYSLFNDKFRRTEVVALELYEGKTQSNTTAFSSVLSPIQPIVDRQAFILPATVEAMKETITEKGITSKHILVALSTGGVVELPWVFLDPRRPFTLTPEMREEGVIPYMPELPIPSESIINYNQTLMRIQGIHTSPSGLESTSLVLVYGLDIFYTRVAPSKTFDVLKEDFDYFLITVVLTALLLASYVTKKLSSKKALKQAWK